MRFRFDGSLPVSKSIANRLLIISSFAETPIYVSNEDSALDISLLSKSLNALKNGDQDFYCGLGGTTFRFFVLRCSRESGAFLVRVDQKLLERPQDPLFDLLKVFGVHYEICKDGLKVQGSGWSKPSTIVKVDTSFSSQFISSLILNAWNLNFDLHVQVSSMILSESYFKMTKEICKKSGMIFNEISETEFVVPKNQQIKLKQIDGEPDLSSAFTVCAFGAALGFSKINGWPSKSLQPDKVFLDVLEDMGVQVERAKDYIKVTKPNEGFLKPVSKILADSPDLFPVLSVLCGTACGISSLRGAPQLAYKESHRIHKTSELLNLVGVRHEVFEDGLVIYGQSLNLNDIKQTPRPQSNFKVFDPESDHRMAMAASLASRIWGHIEISNRHVVDKSFSQFWNLLDKGFSAP